MCFVLFCVFFSDKVCRCKQAPSAPENYAKHFQGAFFFFFSFSLYLGFLFFFSYFIPGIQEILFCEGCLPASRYKHCGNVEIAKLPFFPLIRQEKKNNFQNGESIFLYSIFSRKAKGFSNLFAVHFLFLFFFSINLGNTSQKTSKKNSGRRLDDPSVCHTQRRPDGQLSRSAAASYW